MPKEGTPIQITLYGNEDEVKGNYSRSIIPWGIMKRAIKLAKSFDQNDLKEEDIDTLAGLVVDAFGNQFSIEDLNNGADLGEMVTILNTIVAKAGGLLPANPIHPGT
jgi:hypothetical protein